MSIFEGVISQYIDSNGKTRILNYKNISLSILPIPPLDLPEIPAADSNLTSTKEVLKFVTDKKLKIVEQDGFSGKIQGVWVKSKIGELIWGYIPIDLKNVGAKEENYIPGVEYNDNMTPDPIFTDLNSQLKNMRIKAKIAEYLKQYSLVEWANDPENFSIENYYYSQSTKNYEYDLDQISPPCSVKRFNKVFYRNKKIIVPDKDTAERLVTFVRATKLNDAKLQEKYSNMVTFDGSLFYTSLDNFRKEPKTFIFMNFEAIIKWRIENSREYMNMTVHAIPRPENKEPYYYRNLNINDGKLMIIQNTENADYKSALMVTKEWEKKINIGYNPENEGINIDDLEFNAYTEDGQTYGNAEKNGDILNIFGYSNGEYAAILFLRD